MLSVVDGQKFNAGSSVPAERRPRDRDAAERMFGRVVAEVGRKRNGGFGMAHWNKRTVVREIKMADPVSGGSRFR